MTGEDLRAILDARREDDAAIALATVFAADPDRLGRVVRGEFGTVEAIVEAKDATDEELVNNEVNAGLYAFDAAWLRRRIGSLEPSSTTGELYLTELVRLAREDGRLVIAVAFEDDGRFDGINDRSQLAAAEWNLRVRRNEQHMRDGVTMRDPSTVYLDWDVVARARRHDRAERHPARGDVGRGGDRHRCRQPDRRLHHRTECPRLGVDRRVVDGRGRRVGRPVQPPPAGQRRRAGARRSATTPSSRTPASARARSSTT